jgi:hypothetical protein
MGEQREQTASRTPLLVVVIIAIVGILVLVVAVSGTFGAPEVVALRPAERIIVAHGQCDSVTIEDSTRLLCADGSEWIGIRVNPPAVAETTP